MNVINFKYIEATCNTYDHIDDQRFCWLLHNLAEGIDRINCTIDRIFYLMIGYYIFLILYCLFKDILK